MALLLRRKSHAMQGQQFDDHNNDVKLTFLWRHLSLRFFLWINCPASCGEMVSAHDRFWRWSSCIAAVKQRKNEIYRTRRKRDDRWWFSGPVYTLFNAHEHFMGTRASGIDHHISSLFLLFTNFERRLNAACGFGSSWNRVQKMIKFGFWFFFFVTGRTLVPLHINN